MFSRPLSSLSCSRFIPVIYRRLLYCKLVKNRIVTNSYSHHLCAKGLLCAGSLQTICQQELYVCCSSLWMCLSSTIRQCIFTERTPCVSDHVRPLGRALVSFDYKIVVFHTIHNHVRSQQIISWIITCRTLCVSVCLPVRRYSLTCDFIRYLFHPRL